MSLTNLFSLMLKGGSGSGNFGHGGIPGHVGGSTSKGGKTMIKDGPNVISEELPPIMKKVLSLSGIDDVDITLQTNKLKKFQKNTRRGYYSKEDNMIAIFEHYTDKKTGKNKILTDNEKGWTLAHELGHVDTHRTGNYSSHKPDNERRSEVFAEKIMSKIVSSKDLEDLKKWRRRVFDPASSRYLED